jgi:hypothetical protein
MADEEKTKVDLRRSWIEKKIQENMRHIKKEKLNKGKNTTTTYRLRRIVDDTIVQSRNPIHHFPTPCNQCTDH